MMVIGGGVRGGKVYGRWPGLAREQRYEGRDLAVTTDFRTVFAEVVPRPPRRSTDTRTSSRASRGPSAGRVPGVSVSRTVRANAGTPRTLRSRSDDWSHATLPLVTLHDLRTPCVLVDWPRAERNIDAHAGGRRRRAACGCGRTPRRTSRPTIARLQIERGAVGICCAKLGEAEVFADAGIEDIRLPYPLNPGQRRSRVRARRARRAVVHRRRPRGRARRGRTSMRRAGREARRAGQGGRRLPSLRHRSATRRARPRSSRAIAALPGLRFRGLLSHAGHGYGASSDAETASDRRARGAAC